jgi:hypothetical protein
MRTGCSRKVGAANDRERLQDDVFQGRESFAGGWRRRTRGFLDRDEKAVFVGVRGRSSPAPAVRGRTPLFVTGRGCSRMVVPSRLVSRLAAYPQDDTPRGSRGRKKRGGQADRSRTYSNLAIDPGCVKTLEAVVSAQQQNRGYGLDADPTTDVVCDASQNDGGHRPAREDHPEHLHPSAQRDERERGERARAEAPLDPYGELHGHEHEQPHE